MQLLSLKEMFSVYIHHIRSVETVKIFVCTAEDGLTCFSNLLNGLVNTDKAAFSSL